MLSVSPAPRGFGFVVVDQSYHAIDWGVKAARAKPSDVIDKAIELIESHGPDLLVIDDDLSLDGRRGPRVRALIQALCSYALAQELQMEKIERTSFDAVFHSIEAYTVADISTVAANVFPELQPRLPAARKVWEGPKFATPMFRAAALIIASEPFSSRRAGLRVSR